MTTAYTDLQLQQALAKMLPLRFIVSDKQVFWSPEQGQQLRPGEYVLLPVLDTEWLHVCWLAEKTLNKVDHWQYITYLMCEFNWSLQANDSLEEYDNAFILCHASWQQRTIALAKVKGVEIPSHM